MIRGLNVGSGQRPFTTIPGVAEWCNVDSQERWEPDVCCNAANLPFPDESADFIVLHHVLEHFGCGEGKFLIEEAKRVLKPGGSLLVFVPDLRALADRWIAGGLSTQIYVTNLYGAFMGDDADRHRWGFDNNSLFDFLRDGEWTFMGIFNWRQIPGADISRDFWILGAECIK